MTHEITIPEEVAARARQAVERMIALKAPAQKKRFALHAAPADVVVEGPVARAQAQAAAM
jgi:hypothetical protein